jgi:hypothetical protein
MIQILMIGSYDGYIELTTTHNPIDIYATSE